LGWKKREELNERFERNGLFIGSESFSWNATSAHYEFFELVFPRGK
jgi:hypothetical protein